MNESPRVNPDDCRTCGECCKNYMLFYPNWWPEDKQYEMIRIAYCKGINATIREDKEAGGHWLIFNHPCQFLIDDEGIYSCEIYNDPVRDMTQKEKIAYYEKLLSGRAGSDPRT